MLVAYVDRRTTTFRRFFFVFIVIGGSTFCSPRAILSLAAVAGDLLRTFDLALLVLCDDDRMIKRQRESKSLFPQSRQ